MRLATSLVTNSYYSQDEAGRNTGMRRDQVRVIYHGLPDYVETLPGISRPRMALSVGKIDRSNLSRKGHESFVQAAALLPDVEFVLAGAWVDDAVDYLRSIASSNVTFPGHVDDKTLLEYYRRASVYVQPSLHEGFGLSVAEAMLAGCVPVVTRVGALPEVVGAWGVYIQNQDPEETANGIREALGLSDSVRKQARQRILNCFPLRRRQLSFEELIDGLIDGEANAGKARAEHWGT
jgi:glycosyltransferase involved in cell wall biosynthesis